MLNSVLIDILKTFSKDELSGFQDFVESPFHNSKTPVIKLYLYIKKFAPSFKNEKLLKNNVWKVLFPDKPHNYGVMKNLIHDLTKLAEKFIALTYASDHETVQDINILRSLSERNQPKITEKYLEKAAKKIEDSKLHDANYYKNKFDIEKIRISSLYSKLSDKNKLGSITEFEESGMYLMESFLISILEHYVLINSINKIYKTGIKTPLLEELLKFIKGNESVLNNFFIKVFYYTLMLEKEQNDKYYYKLKEILTQLDSNYTVQFKYMIWENIGNYNTFKFHAGDRSAMKEQFELIKLSLSKKIYSSEDEEYFFMSNFITYFNVAIHLNELEWAENFIYEYNTKLDPNAREDIKNFSLASICMKRRKYSEANEFISKIRKLHEPNMKCGLKIMMLITYYELGWFESALNVVDSFKHLLDHDKNIQEVIKEKVRKFIRAYLILLDYNNRKDEDLKLKFNKYINETTEINSLPWLKRKAREIGIEPDNER
ncbi:MAG: hypothetical protein ABI462_08920 [Ignavibacteria bacterium]